MIGCRHGTGWRFALLPAARQAGWLPAAGSAAGIGLLLLLNATVWHGFGDALVPTARVVEAVLPLAVGLHAAFLLSPEDEKPLELLLSCPRPLSLALAERLLIVAMLQGGVALAGTLAGLGLGGEPVRLAAARWLPPSVFVASVVLYVTMSTRKGALGALTTAVLWGGMLLGGDGLLERWPWLWPLHLFLQPAAVSPAAYAINRATLVLAGGVFVSLSMYLTRDEERLLGIRDAARGREA